MKCSLYEFGLFSVAPYLLGDAPAQSPAQTVLLADKNEVFATRGSLADGPALQNAFGTADVVGAAKKLSAAELQSTLEKSGVDFIAEPKRFDTFEDIPARFTANAVAVVVIVSRNLLERRDCSSAAKDEKCSAVTVPEPRGRWEY